jgi:hypothetical protein
MTAPAFEPLENLPPARKRITAVLLTHGWNRPEIEEMIADFAGELAGEIRGERDRMDVPGSPATPDVIAGMSYAANLIDPQGHEGVRPGEETT